MLLAKSFLPKKDPNDSLILGAAKYTGHISFVLQASDILVEQLGETIFQRLGLQNFDLKYFANTVKLGAYLHDWGKANRHFQEMVYWNSIDFKSKESHVLAIKKQLQKLKEDNPHPGGQMLRHEVISGILALQVPSFRNWLEQCPDTDLMIAVWAAMGHHLKIGIERGKWGKSSGTITTIPDGTGSQLAIYTHHADFKAVLRMGKQLGLPEELPELPSQSWSKSQLENALSALRTEFKHFSSQLNEQQQKLIAAVKATVIAADLAGSALPLVEEDFQGWIKAVLNQGLLSQELEQLVEERLQGKPLNNLQKKVAQSIRRVTLVKAGCGTGKTIAAYQWAKKWALGYRLFFCYPTTGTASQGYIDYADGTKIEATLMHSRAHLDRELLFSGDEDNSEDLDARLMAFQAWRKKLIICTVDSVLGLIQNNRKPLYSWPAIAQSAFVFDEVHAFDQALFGALLQFLKAFSGAPILLMSASFTPGQLQAIRQVMAELGEELDEPIEGPQELETLERYQLQFVAVTDIITSTEIWQPVLNALCHQQKVLWVTNSVQSCIDLYRIAQEKIRNLDPKLEKTLLIYHSRFRYQDRVKKHEAVIQAFRSDDVPVLAITTQVCEMSLDINADLLISAMAPAAALIQRLGRLNRYMTDPQEPPRQALIYPWNDLYPYPKELQQTGQELIQALAHKTAISQRDLAEVMAQFDCGVPEIVDSIWLGGNWCTYPSFLREGGGTVTVLLQADLDRIKQAAKQQDKFFMQEAQKWSVPIRIPKNLSEWKRCRFYPIAPTNEIFYSEETGAEPCK